jgi:hypothetical protein
MNSNVLITIVFQGPIVFVNGTNVTKKAIKTAMKIFPNSEIILSTWENESIADLYDLSIKIILNKDPGSGLRKFNPKTYHNVNRIIVSSINGINEATNDIVIKCRTDIIFKNNNSLNIFYKYPQYDKNFAFLSKKVLVSNQTTINTNYGPPLLYHICDWFYLGIKEDLIKIFDINLMPSEYENYYNYFEKPENKIDVNNLSRYMAEDYITSTFLNKYTKINHDYYCEYTDFEHLKFEKILANNFIVVDNVRLGIYANKYYNLSKKYLWKSYTFFEWVQIYYNYAAKNNKYKLHDFDRLNLFILNPIQSIRYFYTLLYKKWHKNI